MLSLVKTIHVTLKREILLLNGEVEVLNLFLIKECLEVPENIQIGMVIKDGKHIIEVRKIIFDNGNFVIYIHPFHLTGINEKCIKKVKEIVKSKEFFEKKVDKFWDYIEEA